MQNPQGEKLQRSNDGMLVFVSKTKDKEADESSRAAFVKKSLWMLANYASKA
jgi:hypothetical protein